MNAKRAVVIGGGIVGLSSALFLIRDGWAVTLMDPQPPGETTSGGNAGLLAIGHVTPIGMPGVLRQVPRMLLDRGGPLRISASYAHRVAPWLARLVLASRPARAQAISHALRTLLERTFPAYESLLDESNARALIRRRGFAVVYRDEAHLRAAMPELELRRRAGVRIELLDRPALRERLPALSSRYTRAAWYPDYGHCVDPTALSQAIAAEFARRGGAFVRRPATGFERGPAGIAAVLADGVAVPADLVVIAAGAWSRPLAAMLGARVPLDTERGYHIMLPEQPFELPCPVTPGDLRFCITPMTTGLRAAGTIEFAGLAAPPDPRRHALLLRHVRQALPEVRTEGYSTWMGFRPSLPDSLPVIGRVPGVANAILAFGHGHIGLTAGPATGQLVADLAAGRPPAVELAPFGVGRFGKYRRSIRPVQ
jgi:D-amino-acid dehydrogenase